MRPRARSQKVRRPIRILAAALDEQKFPDRIQWGHNVDLVPVEQVPKITAAVRAVNELGRCVRLKGRSASSFSTNLPAELNVNRCPQQRDPLPVRFVEDPVLDLLVRH